MQARILLDPNGGNINRYQCDNVTMSLNHDRLKYEARKFVRVRVGEFVRVRVGEFVRVRVEEFVRVKVGVCQGEGRSL